MVGLVDGGVPFHFHNTLGFTIYCAGWIMIGGRKVGSFDNMFLRYRWKVKPFLQLARDNRITIVFESPVSAARERRELISYHIPVGSEACFLSFL